MYETIASVYFYYHLCMPNMVFELVPSPHVRLFEGGLGLDKVVHGVMYLGTCSVFWLEYLRSRRQWSRIKLTLIAVVVPILMSGIIELAQTYCTTYRAGEWADLLANSIGVLLALPVMLVMRKKMKK